MNSPVIIEESLCDGELHNLLKTTKFKVRTSSTTPYYSCVFPVSSVVFIIRTFTATNLESKNIETKKFLNGIDKSLNLHYKQYVFLLAPLFGMEELSSLNELQRRYLKTTLEFIPVHNNAECLTAMIDIVKINCSPTSDIVKERYVSAMNRQISEEGVMHILKKSDFSDHEVAVAIHGCGSLRSLALSDPQKVINQTSLGSHHSSLLIEFLSKKY